MRISLLLSALMMLTLVDLSPSSWTLWIYNSKVKGAGTRANAYLQAFGSRGGQSGKFLINKHPNFLKIGEFYVFKVNFPDIDKLERITVQRDKRGQFHAWNVDKIVLQKDNESIEYVFPCNCWIKTCPKNTTMMAEPRNVTKSAKSITTSKYNVTTIPTTDAISLCTTEDRTRTTELAPPTVNNTNTKKTAGKDSTAKAVAASQMTAPPVTESETNDEICACACENEIDTGSLSKNASLPKQIEEDLQKMIKKMEVDKKNLSKYVRQKTSAEDRRPSAIAIGSAGVVFLVIPFLLILLLDLVSLIKYLGLEKILNP